MECLAHKFPLTEEFLCLVYSNESIPRHIPLRRAFRHETNQRTYFEGVTWNRSGNEFPTANKRFMKILHPSYSLNGISLTTREQSNQVFHSPASSISGLKSNSAYATCLIVYSSRKRSQPVSDSGLCRKLSIAACRESSDVRSLSRSSTSIACALLYFFG